MNKNSQASISGAEFPFRAGAGGRRASALSYGPFSYVAAPILGFILGSAAFLILDASATDHVVTNELPFLLRFAAGGAVLMLIGALIGNWLIGRNVREQVEGERALFAQGNLPLLPRPDVPGIMLQPASAYAEAARRRQEAGSPTAERV